MLPTMVNRDRIKKHSQVEFRGYDHREDPGKNGLGTLWDTENLSADRYPQVGTRKPRRMKRQLTKPNGLYANDGLYWVDGTDFYADGVLKGNVADSRKTFVSLGAYILIFPDKAYYNKLTGDFGSMEAEWSGTASFRDGTFAGESAEANTIYAVGIGSGFRVGDAVTISGSTNEENNKTSVIQEIGDNELRFYENCFVNGQNQSLTIKRTVPELDFVCENENRVWGCKEDTIYASKLGDPFNWNVFDGVATDSYAVNVGSEGDFTGCVSFLGYPVFFKENKIYKVYGDRPANFQVMASASMGVEEGSGQSLAIAGEVLFYLSRAGVMAYSGGIPQSVSAPFGEQRFHNAVAGSDGNKYYVSMEGEDGYSLFVYDTRFKLWYREDGTQAAGFAFHRELHCLDENGEIWATDGAEGTEETGLESRMETGDFTENDPNRKGVSKLQLRMELEDGAEVAVKIRFDGGQWHDVATLTAEGKRSVYLPIIPRRCDHFRLKLEGRGAWTLHSLVRESYSGSEL